VSKSLDQLARNLASGMSRRKALWTFITGLGVVATFTGRKAYAGGLGRCAGFCDAQALVFLEMCLEASRSCGTDSCAEYTMISINGGGGIGVNGGGGIGVNGSGPFTCVPVTY
jgi:hypothetical protein